jgi:PAS domain S-box-containing protein
MKLLLAEDNPADARLVREMLSETHGLNFELTHATRLHDAIAQLRSTRFDAVLLDLGLPDSQGMETIEQTLRTNGTLPVVVLTGLNDERFAEEILRAGAQDYLVKGQFGSDLLLRTIRYAVERKRAEVKLRHLAAIVDCCSEGIISKTLDGMILSWNTGAERIYGYTAAEMVGSSIRRIIPPKLVHEMPALVARLIQGEAIVQYETTRRHKDGRELTVELTFSPVRDDTTRVVAVSVVASDITDRKRAEIALMQSHAEVRRFNQLAVGRELRMIELKQEVNALATTLGRPAPYPANLITSVLRPGTAVPFPGPTAPAEAPQMGAASAEVTSEASNPGF